MRHITAAVVVILLGVPTLASADLITLRLDGAVSSVDVDNAAVLPGVGVFPGVAATGFLTINTDAEPREHTPGLYVSDGQSLGMFAFTAADFTLSAIGTGVTQLHLGANSLVIEFDSNTEANVGFVDTVIVRLFSGAPLPGGATLANLDYSLFTSATMSAGYAVPFEEDAIHVNAAFDQVSTVPEPSTLALLVFGGAGLGMFRVRPRLLKRLR